MKDEETRAVMTLSLESASDRFVRMLGVVVVPDFEVPFVTALTIESDSDLDRTPAPDAGRFVAGVDDGPLTNYRYDSRRLEAVDQYQLWALSVVDEQLGARYRVFAIDDPFPILVIPVVAAAVGFAWVVDRHGDKKTKKRLRKLRRPPSN